MTQIVWDPNGPALLGESTDMPVTPVPARKIAHIKRNDDGTYEVPKHAIALKDENIYDAYGELSGGAQQEGIYGGRGDQLYEPVYEVTYDDVVNAPDRVCIVSDNLE